MICVYDLAVSSQALLHNYTNMTEEVNFTTPDLQEEDQCEIANRRFLRRGQQKTFLILMKQSFLENASYILLKKTLTFPKMPGNDQ
jgi:hypothetical protein